MPRISAAEGPSNAFEPVPDAAEAEAEIAPEAEAPSEPSLPRRPPLAAPPPGG